MKHNVKQALRRAALFFPWVRKDKWCFFDLDSSFGGAGGFANKLAREFRARGIQITYYELRAASAALLFTQSLGQWFNRLCQRWKVRTVFRVDGFMVPEYFDNRAQPDAYQDRRLTHSRMAVNYRIQQNLCASDFVIYQSHFTKKLTDLYLYNRHQDFAVIHNGVDLSRFRPIDKQSKRRLRLISAGVLRDEYMLGTILPVFGKLWKGFDLELRIIGPLAEICRRQLLEFQRADPSGYNRIRCEGHIANDHLPACFSEGDILIHPRLGDWCPNVVVEALASGIPVICGSWGGAAELVGEGGIVVPTCKWSYDEDYIGGIVDGIRTILENLDHYRSAARVQAERHLDIRSQSDAYIAALGL